jgi:hypothetical protein
MSLSSSTPSLKKLTSFFSFSVNLMCHIFILLTFLVFFFFFYISKLTTKHIDDELKSLVGKETTEILQNLDQKDTNHLINWNVVYMLSSNLKMKYKKSSQYVKDNNNNLYDQCTCFLILFALIIIIWVLYLVLKGFDLNLKFIALENLVIFTFIGIIEIYFFVNIASKYVPILPDDAVRSVLDRLLYRLNTF